MRRFGPFLYPDAFIILAVLLSSAASIMAEGSRFWGDLEPGPYKVGFRTVERFDYSRTYRAKADYCGQPMDGERARPIQIFIWYPAPASLDGQSISYAEYTYSFPEDSRFMDVLAALQNRENLRATALTGSRPGFLVDLINFEANASRNAEMASGDFPLVLYFPHLLSGVNENSILCEYLASYGYIVAASHPMGLTGLTPEINPKDLETVIGDAQFVFGCLYDLAGWDRNRLGVLGHGSGAAGALLFQMCNTDVEAMVALGGGLNQKDIITLVRDNPFFSPDNMRFPFLCLTSGQGSALDWSLLEDLPFASRLAFEFPEADSLDFTNARALLGLLPDTLGQPHRLKMRRHETMCRIVRTFFDAYLKQLPEAMTRIEDIQAAFGGSTAIAARIMQNVKPIGDLPPTNDQFLYILNTYGAVKALELFEKFSSQFTGRYQVPEVQVNALGYQMLGIGRIEEAIAAFKLNVGAHPVSANCWDSYADGCRTAGDTAMTITCYRKALETIPLDQTLTEDLRTAIRNNAETFLNSMEKQ